MPADGSEIQNTPASSRQFDRDLVISVCAVILSTCALAVSLVQTMSMRAQQYAAVWPRVTASFQYADDGDSVVASLRLRNAGVGPAQVQWAQATYDGVPMASWLALMSRAGRAAGFTNLTGTGNYNSITGEILSPGQLEEPLRLGGSPARAINAEASHIGLRVCYCSVFDRCWQLENANVAAPVPNERVTPVSACERPRTPVL